MSQYVQQIFCVCLQEFPEHPRNRGCDAHPSDREDRLVSGNVLRCSRDYLDDCAFHINQLQAFWKRFAVGLLRLVFFNVHQDVFILREALLLASCAVFLSTF